MVDWRAVIGWGLNLALRTGMAAMVVEVVRSGRNDPRFRDKGIAPRFVTVGMPATLFVPAVRAFRGSGGSRYPVWTDNLFLSILALDLAGNVFDLYDRHRHFDLIPHAHGTGAMTLVFAELFRLPVGMAAGGATIGHVLLEAQEIASDVVFGLSNVRGWWDVVGDVGAGVVGTIAYAAAYERLVRGREPGSAPRGSGTVARDDAVS